MGLAQHGTRGRTCSPVLGVTQYRSDHSQVNLPPSPLLLLKYAPSTGVAILYSPTKGPFVS
eukprot:COSAG02_NODE_148_length_33809_cov_158.369594_22_plen_61_part_00